MAQIPITRRSIVMRRAMLERGYSFDRLSIAIGVEKTKLNRISNEYVRPTPEEARKIASALGLDVRELFGEVE